MIGRSPALTAALWNRGAPYTPSRSRSASAPYPRSAARSTSASGSDAPWRKLNAEAACSSTYGGDGTTAWTLRFVGRRPVDAGDRDVVQPEVHPELRPVMHDVVQTE